MTRSSRRLQRSRELVERLEPRTLLSSTWTITFGNPGIVPSTGIPTPFKNLAPAFTLSLSFFGSSGSFFGGLSAKSGSGVLPAGKPGSSVSPPAKTGSTVLVNSRPGATTGVAGVGRNVTMGVSLGGAPRLVTNGATNLLLPKVTNSGIINAAIIPHM